MSGPIGLPARPRLPKVRRVTARRPHILLLGALLALFAVVGMTALSTWHGATVHDHHASAASPAQHHDDRAAADLDGAVHVAAHAVSQGVDVPVAGAAPPLAAAPDRAWLVGRATLPKALEPPSLLRPPRA